MGRKRRGTPGVSFSWKRAMGLSSAKGKLSRQLGISLTRSGRRQKIGQATRYLLPSLILLIVAASLAVISYAQTISFGAEVTQVIDGDTLIVKDGNGVDHRICLQAVDAPEDGQEFADVAAEKLTERVLHKPVVVEYAAITLDGCFIGKVSLAGQDIGLTMVTDGYAWHFKDYEKQQSLEDRTLYSQAERDARQAKSGLWASSSPLPPWKYRREHPKTDVSAPAAGDSSTGGTVNVKGYYRKDGTYVRPHTRSAPRKKN